MTDTTRPTPPACPEGHSRDAACLAAAEGVYDAALVTANAAHATRSLSAQETYQAALDKVGATQAELAAARVAYGLALADSTQGLSDDIAVAKAAFLIAASACCEADEEEEG